MNVKIEKRIVTILLSILLLTLLVSCDNSGKNSAVSPPSTRTPRPSQITDDTLESQTAAPQIINSGYSLDGSGVVCYNADYERLSENFHRVY